MAKFTCPPQTPSGAGTFANNLVGLQLVTGGGLTQGTFNFTLSASEKVNRNFSTGTFSNPISLDSMGITDINQAKAIIENNYKVYPNFDLTQVTNFVLYGSMAKRMSAAVTQVISYFPGALESTTLRLDYSTGVTAFNVVFSLQYNETTFDLDLSKIRNPFGVDYTTNSTRNLSLREIPVSTLRNMTLEYAKYSMYYNEIGYQVKRIVPTDSLTSGNLNITVVGNPFSGETNVFGNIIIRPNDSEVNKVFNENLDEVENFLLNRTSTPIYTASFVVPKEADDGTYYSDNASVTWPILGLWNLDIISSTFTDYLTVLNDISLSFDSYRTNLISRFFTTPAFKEFDTIGQKMDKVLQIYGRSFDEVNKYITSLSYVTSVNYNVRNDIPSQLLRNLAQTLGWQTNISPITNTDFLNSVFGQSNQDKSMFSGVPVAQTPDELNYQFYRNILLNTAYLFKSKGTRKSIENLLRLIGAPEALVEFNEYVYLADQKININKFNTYYAQISGGTLVEQTPTLESSNVFTLFGVQYTGFTTTATIQDVNITIDEFPIDEFGFPKPITDSEAYFFQIGSGWFEQTPQHRAPEQVNPTLSVFTGLNPDYQTSLKPYTYGQEYLDRFRKFPFIQLGYNISPSVDNNKSWYDSEVLLRVNLDGNINARYFVSDDKLVLNVKNTEIFLNPAQGLLYDVWYMSRLYNYPIPNQGLNYVNPNSCFPNALSCYPDRGGVDWTIINPQPKQKTFFEFAQTFWKNTINVRNRQYSTDGKTSGYPTLQSIYWKYLQSLQDVNIENNNFTYQTMIEYVNGLGDYWIRLIEQMVPATTIWNTGVKLENSIFHRQKFQWKRQRGCQIILDTPPPTPNPSELCECISVTGASEGSNTLITTLNPNGFVNGKQSFLGYDPCCGLVRDMVISYNSGSTRWEYYYDGVLVGTLNSTSDCPIGSVWLSTKNNVGTIASTNRVICPNPASFTPLRPNPCRPCELNDSLYTYDCPVQNTECPKYPWLSNPLLGSFGSVLGKLLNDYLTSIGYDPNNCSLNTLTTEWYVDIRIDDIQVVTYPFFNGIGYNLIPLSYPTTSNWDTALVAAMDLIKPLGYDYYFTSDDTIVVYNQVCSVSEADINFKLNIGINFSIYCV